MLLVLGAGPVEQNGEVEPFHTPYSSLCCPIHTKSHLGAHIGVPDTPKGNRVPPPLSPCQPGAAPLSHGRHFVVSSSTQGRCFRVSL